LPALDLELLISDPDNDKLQISVTINSIKSAVHPLVNNTVKTKNSKVGCNVKTKKVGCKNLVFKIKLCAAVLLKLNLYCLLTEKLCQIRNGIRIRNFRKSRIRIRKYGFRIHNTGSRLLLFTGLSILVVTTFALKFKDYNLINNTLLQEIKKQNLELKRSMENFQVGKALSLYIIRYGIPAFLVGKGRYIC